MFGQWILKIAVALIHIFLECILGVLTVTGTAVLAIMRTLTILRMFNAKDTIAYLQTQIDAAKIATNSG